MYKNLIDELKKLHLHAKDLLDEDVGLPYSSEKTISVKLNQKGKYDLTIDDKKDIYRFLKKKGSTASFDYLFETVEVAEEKRSYNRLSIILNERMKTTGKTQRDIIDFFKKKGISISRSTVYAWLHGNVDSIQKKHLDILCDSELLDINPMYLSGYDEFKPDAFDLEFSEEAKELYNYYSDLFTAIFNLLIYDDSRYRKFEPILQGKYGKELKDDFISDAISHDVYPMIKEYFDLKLFHKWVIKTDHSFNVKYGNRKQRADYHAPDFYDMSKDYEVFNNGIDDIHIPKSTIEKHGREKIQEELNSKKEEK